MTSSPIHWLNWPDSFSSAASARATATGSMPLKRAPTLARSALGASMISPIAASALAADMVASVFAAETLAAVA